MLCSRVPLRRGRNPVDATDRDETRRNTTDCDRRDEASPSRTANFLAVVTRPLRIAMMSCPDRSSGNLGRLSVPRPLNINFGQWQPPRSDIQPGRGPGMLLQRCASPSRSAGRHLTRAFPGANLDGAPVRSAYGLLSAAQRSSACGRLAEKTASRAATQVSELRVGQVAIGLAARDLVAAQQTPSALPATKGIPSCFAHSPLS